MKSRKCHIHRTEKPINRAIQTIVVHRIHHSKWVQPYSYECHQCLSTRQTLVQNLCGENIANKKKEKVVSNVVKIERKKTHSHKTRSNQDRASEIHAETARETLEGAFIVANLQCASFIPRCSLNIGVVRVIRFVWIVAYYFGRRIIRHWSVSRSVNLKAQFKQQTVAQ